MHRSKLLVFIVLLWVFQIDALTTTRTTTRTITRTTTRKRTTAKARTTTKKKVVQVVNKGLKFDQKLESTPDVDTGFSCYDACYPNSTFLDDAGRIQNSSIYGTFVSACDKTYLMGTKEVTWEQNWKLCCALGMQPVLIETLEESQCLATSLPANVTADEAYWTGGFKHELNNMWSWCTKDSPEPIDESLITEVSNDKSKFDDTAIQLSFDFSSMLTNWKPENKYNLMCESVTKSVVELVGNKNCRAKCINKECTRNTTLFVKKGLDERFELKDRYKHGRWVSKCGRYFLFSNKMVTYSDARDMCCALGTRLIALKTEAKRKCITKLAKDFPEIVGNFWTSGADFGCPNNFRWCSVDRAFLKRNINWAPGEPNVTKGDCVSLKVSNVHPNQTTLAVDDCNAKKFFACEVRQSGTSIEAVQKECAELLTLSLDEVYGLDNPNNYTYRMKCYVQCLGDNLGMLVNGTLQEGNVLRLMESSNEKSDMQKGYEAIERCKSYSVKNDDCENAYQLYMCAKREAPVVFGKVVVYKFRIDGYVYPPVKIEVPRICNMNQNELCRENRTAINEFDTLNMTTMGGIAITGWDGKKWYKSEYALNHTYELAFKRCCALGMYLPITKTFDEFKKLYDFINGSKVDNFYGETYSNPDGERWCRHDALIDPEMTADGFSLAHERSFLYTRRGGKPLYKLTTLMFSYMFDTRVNYFYCESWDEPTETTTVAA
ncbi:uncharacterized protein LOC132197211 [Neocloeon triangulifer]|uniref:uncharacterized protein LOC132197211 n=1 Tax=Neocloeon triangulifer TaxID=2078957 RepID=UPI00286F49C6|nr:uncharacterized protein LOC132197211 [Neocloeon triangulifer]